MKTDKEILEEIRRIVEAVINLDKSILGIPSDDHIEMSELVLRKIHSN